MLIPIRNGSFNNARSLPLMEMGSMGLSEVVAIIQLSINNYLY
jgi:hypothetical protein